MRYIALACDYDGTLARGGQVDEETLAALDRVRSSGRKLILVTGRELPDLVSVFPHIDAFDLVVAENGGLLYDPRRREERILAEAAPPALVERLRGRGVVPLEVGRVIVATWRPQEAEVLAAIQDLGLERQVIFNKDAVMVLPSGVNKATGLMTALKELRLSPHNVVAVGDAENDHAMLQASECGVAVANALAPLKERADLVTAGDHGGGVRELIERLVTTDLVELEPALARHAILLGHSQAGDPVRLPSYGGAVLVTGSSGGGKSTLTGGVLERLASAGYQFCLIDPEGDYEELKPAIVLGTVKNPPAVKEILSALDAPDQNAVVNLTGVQRDDRPAFFEQLFPALQEMRARSARPHWIIADEAHHLVPASWRPTPSLVPQHVHNVVLVTLSPELLAPALLQPVTTLLLLGDDDPARSVAVFAGAVGDPPPQGPSEAPVGRRQAALWRRDLPLGFVRFEVEPPRDSHHRHRRKYAEGELAEEGRFVFRGPEGKLRLAAENLRSFLKIADGVDEATWLHHLGRGEYSRWFRDVIKDEQLAGDAEAVEGAHLPASESLARIKDAIQRRYAV